MGLVENVAVAFGIASLSPSVPKLFLLPVTKPAILSPGCRPMSGNADSVIFESGVAENVGVAFEIASLSVTIQKLPLLPVWR